MTTANVAEHVIDPAQKSMEEIVALAKRCGFVYPASEIYGGLNGFWDFGPLGVQLKNNIRDHWWTHLVECPPIGEDGDPLQIVGLDSAIIQHPKTWEASGHLSGFTDPMMDEKETKKRLRADHVWVRELEPSDHERLFIALPVSGEGEAEKAFDSWLENGEPPRGLGLSLSKLAKRYVAGAYHFKDRPYAYTDIPEDARLYAHWPEAQNVGTLMEPREFNLMFETYVGAIRNEDNKAYLRPETAQGIFLQYKNIVDTCRVKVPFGVAQIGKSFRNEVTPRNFIFRGREFEQMEMEWFCRPDEAEHWYDFWKDQRMAWWRSLGVSEANLRFRDHEPDELSHYSNMTVDIEYRYPFTAPDFGELEGIAHRGCYDLTQHQTYSGQKMEYFDQALQQQLQNEGLDKEQIRQRSRYIPSVIEPASGLTRALLVLLCEAYTPTPDRKGTKAVMSFKPRFAPVKAGIFPLVNKDGMPEIARKLYLDLREKYAVEYDAKQSIGKRYARMDEIGTPLCFTIDGQTLDDQSLTVRDRDTQAQHRINLDQVEVYLQSKLAE